MSMQYVRALAPVVCLLGACADASMPPERRPAPEEETNVPLETATFDDGAYAYTPFVGLCQEATLGALFELFGRRCLSSPNPKIESYFWRNRERPCESRSAGSRAERVVYDYSTPFSRPEGTYGGDGQLTQWSFEALEGPGAILLFDYDEQGRLSGVRAADTGFFAADVPRFERIYRNGAPRRDELVAANGDRRPVFVHLRDENGRWVGTEQYVSEELSIPREGVVYDEFGRVVELQFFTPPDLRTPSLTFRHRWVGDRLVRTTCIDRLDSTQFPQCERTSIVTYDYACDGCESDGECGPGWICTGGRCELGECERDSDCPGATNLCRDRACVDVECVSNSDCSSGERCGPGNRCERVTTDNACQDCLNECRDLGISGCCTGRGCLCETECAPKPSDCGGSRPYFCCGAFGCLCRKCPCSVIACF